MSARDMSGWAFPVVAPEGDLIAEGMTIRAYMATAALPGIMPWALSVNMSAEGVAHHAVAVADALLLELAKP